MFKKKGTRGGFATGFLVKVDVDEKQKYHHHPYGANGLSEGEDRSEGEDLSEEVSDEAGISEGDLNALFEGAGLPGMLSQGDVLSAVVAGGLISEDDLSGVDTFDLSAVVDGGMIKGDDVAAWSLKVTAGSGTILSAAVLVDGGGGVIGGCNDCGMKRSACNCEHGQRIEYRLI